MSKLSLSKRLFGSSGENPPTANHPQPLIPQNQSNSSPPRPAAITAQTGSPLSGWSDDNDSGGGELPPRNLLQQEQETQAHADVNEDTNPFDYEVEDPLLHELYDTFDDDFHCRGSGGDGIHSENEEEELEDNDEEEEEEEDDNNEDVVDLCDSPSPQHLESFDNLETMEKVPSPVVDNNQTRRSCDVCGLELGSMHYLQQVQHVKHCLSKRNLCKPPISAPNSDTMIGAPQKATVTAAKKTQHLDMDIKDWLHELEFDAFIDKFVSEEIDMTLVHALNEDDLSLLGITRLLDQRKFIRAGKKVGDEVRVLKKSKRAAAVAAWMNANPPTIDQRQKKKQKTLQELGVSSTIGTIEGRKPTPGSGGNQNINSRRSVKSAEQALLLNLYPDNNNNYSRYSAAAPTMIDSIDVESGGAPLRTPPLPQTTALASARVPPSSSLFTSAAHCKQVTETLEARIEKRRIGQRDLAAAGGISNEQLGRGGLVFNKVEESRAVKVMKLQALKEELRTHENTVLELKRLIAGLEMELGQ